MMNKIGSIISIIGFLLYITDILTFIIAEISNILHGTGIHPFYEEFYEANKKNKKIGLGIMIIGSMIGAFGFLLEENIIEVVQSFF